MAAWQSTEVLESTPAITPRNSSAQTPSKRLLWFITGNMAWVEADGVLTIRAMAHVPHAGAEGESPGSFLGSTALFFPWFIISCKYMFTRMLQLLKLPSLQAWHKAHSRNTEVRISEAILWGDVVNVTSEVPHISCTVTSWTTALHIFQWPDLTQITCLHNPREIQVLMNVCFRFKDKSWFCNSRQPFKNKPCLHVGSACLERS